MVSRLKIAVFTGSRAEYDLLFPLLCWLSRQVAPQGLVLLVGGEHLHRKATARSVLQADADTYGWQVQWLSSESSVTVQAQSTYVVQSVQHLQASTVFETTPVDCFIVLGDRVEAFALALGAFYQQVPIVHLAGGDVTEGGCVDDKLRWLLTELATLHVAFSQASANRLLAKGVAPHVVVHSGSLAVDNVLNTPLLPLDVLCQSIGWQLEDSRPIVLFTQHPVGVEGEQSARYLAQTLNALRQANVRVIATAPNLDGATDSVNQAISQVITQSQQHDAPETIVWVETLGRQGYLSWLAACNAVVGNSSSLLYEAPLFGKPALCIGPRQQGREHTSNVCFVDYGEASVLNGLTQVLHNPAFIAQAKQAVSPFGSGCAAPIIGQFSVDYFSKTRSS